MADMIFKALIMDENAIRRSLVRISHEIIERNADLTRLALVGIKTGGIPLAKRLADLIGKNENITPDYGTLDIAFYRDDVTKLFEQPAHKGSDLNFDVEGRVIVLVDDVLYTGRTARAAIEAIMEKGRPAGIQFAVLIDRGHRELPVRADYVGKNLPTSKNEVVKVELIETDGADRVLLTEKNKTTKGDML